MEAALHSACRQVCAALAAPAAAGVAADGVVAAIAETQAMLDGPQRAMLLARHGPVLLQRLLQEGTAWLPHLEPAHKTAYSHLVARSFPPRMFVCTLAEAVAWAGATRARTALQAHLWLLHVFAEESGLARLLSGADDAPATLDPAIEERVAGAVLALPAKIANAQFALAAQRADAFDSAAYLARLGAALAQLAAARQVPSIARTLIARACVLGHVAALLQPVLAMAAGGAVPLDVVLPLLHVPDSAVEALCVHLIRTLPLAIRAEILFHLCVRHGGQYRYVLTEKLLYSRWFSEVDVAVCLTRIFSRLRITEEMLRTLAKVWGSLGALEGCSYDQLFYLTKMVVLLSRELPPATCEALMTATLESVPRFIQHGDLRVRALGLTASSLLTRRAVPDRALDFDVAHSKDVELLRVLAVGDLDEIVQNADAPINIKPNAPGGASASSATAGQPSAQPPAQPPAQAPPQPPGPEAALDSDDEFPAYALPVEESDEQHRQRKAAPRYVRDCLTGLTASQDSVLVTASLRSAASLIRTQPHETQEVGKALAATLVGLPNDYALPDYNKCKIEALRALAVVAPVQAGVYLAEDFSSASWSSRHRIEILHALVEAALELSGLSAAPGAIPGNSPAALPSPAASSAAAKAVVPVGKTRRFASATAVPRSAPNLFGPVAAAWFTRLAEPIRTAASQPHGPLSDLAVLASLLRALATFVYCARNTPARDLLATALLEVCAIFRGHRDSQVRTAALYGLGMAAGALPAALEALPLPVEDMLESLRIAAREDPAEGVRDAARNTLNLLAAVSRPQLL